LPSIVRASIHDLSQEGTRLLTCREATHITLAQAFSGSLRFLPLPAALQPAFLAIHKTFPPPPGASLGRGTPFAVPARS